MKKVCIFLYCENFDWNSFFFKIGFNVYIRMMVVFDFFFFLGGFWLIMDVVKIYIVLVGYVKVIIKWLLLYFMLYVILDCKLNLWWKKKGDI